MYHDFTKYHRVTRHKKACKPCKVGSNVVSAVKDLQVLIVKKQKTKQFTGTVTFTTMLHKRTADVVGLHSTGKPAVNNPICKAPECQKTSVALGVRVRVVRESVRVV